MLTIRKNKGRLDKKGFAISGMVYPILILTLFLIVQILFTFQSRKNILNREKDKLLNSVNQANEIYDFEKLTNLINEQQSKISTLENRVGVLENAVQDSELKILNGVNPTTLTKRGKYYILSAVDIPYGSSGYFEVETTSDPTWRRITYKYNGGSAIYEKIMQKDTWGNWKMIAGEVELWSGSLVPNDSIVDFQYDLRPYGTLRFVFNSGEYTVDAAYIRSSSWTGGVTGWATPGAGNELVGIGAYNTGDKKLSIRAGTRTSWKGLSLTSSDNSKPITKIIGRP